jgi:hypothetical protein
MKTRKWLFWIALTGIVLLVLLSIPLTKRIESIDLGAIYPGTLPGVSMVIVSEELVHLDYQGLRVAVWAKPRPDTAKIEGEPTPRLFDDLVANINLGEQGIATRQREDPNNLARGVKIGYPCEVVFRRENALVRVTFEQPPGIYRWPEEVNRLPDQEQIKLLTDVGILVDQAILSEHPGVKFRRRSGMDWVRMKAECLWTALILRTIGGGPHHH